MHTRKVAHDIIITNNNTKLNRFKVVAKRKGPPISV